jgi:hypothetical protein
MPLDLISEEHDYDKEKYRERYWKLQKLYWVILASIPERKIESGGMS